MTDAKAIAAALLAASSGSEDAILLRFLAMRLTDLGIQVQEMSRQLARTVLLPTPKSMVFDVSDVDVVDLHGDNAIDRRTTREL
jgi:hypothetical protein